MTFITLCNTQALCKSVENSVDIVDYFSIFQMFDRVRAGYPLWIMRVFSHPATFFL